MDETLGEAAGPDERKEVEEMMNRVEAETTPPSHGKPSIFYRVVPSFTECDFGFFLYRLFQIFAEKTNFSQLFSL